MLGHATIEMTMKYAHLGPKARQQAVQLLDQPAPAPDGHLGDTCSPGKQKAQQPLRIAGLFKWRRRESNPRPKAFRPSTLRA